MAVIYICRKVDLQNNLAIRRRFEKITLALFLFIKKLNVKFIFDRKVFFCAEVFENCRNLKQKFLFTFPEVEYIISKLHPDTGLLS